jgi:hypothetical protein
MVPLSALGEAWAAFFHAPASATTIASFRILFGGILLVNAAGLARDLAFLYGPRGAVAEANRAGLFGRERWSLLRWGGDHEAWLRACLAIHKVAAVSLTVGAGTRASAAVVCATLMTIQSRNPLVKYGGDDVLRVMSFLLIFAPAGHSLSVDSWLGSGWWVSREPIDPWCWRLMQLQVSILYFKAFAAKLAGESWRDGRAVYLATEVEDFRRRRLPAWARRPAWCRLGAWATLAVEGALGSLVWIAEWRGPVLVAGVAMHVVLEGFLNLYLFGAIMIVCLWLFLSPETIEAGLRAAGIF